MKSMTDRNRINFLKLSSLKPKKSFFKTGIVTVIVLGSATLGFFRSEMNPPLAQVKAIQRIPAAIKTSTAEVSAPSPVLQIILNSDSLFESGTAKLDLHSGLAQQEVESLVKNLSKAAVVEIEGHTDNSPVVRQKKFYPSNWELSAARAASLIPLFEKAGVEKDKLRVIGYGDSRPVALNQVPENAKNRRIVLRIFPQGDLPKNL